MCSLGVIVSVICLILIVVAQRLGRTGAQVDV
jgi:hypothetical protein